MVSWSFAVKKYGQDSKRQHHRYISCCEAWSKNTEKLGLGSWAYDRIRGRVFRAKDVIYECSLNTKTGEAREEIYGLVGLGYESSQSKEVRCSRR